MEISLLVIFDEIPCTRGSLAKQLKKIRKKSNIDRNQLKLLNMYMHQKKYRNRKFLLAIFDEIPCTIAHGALVKFLSNFKNS